MLVKNILSFLEFLRAVLVLKLCCTAIVHFLLIWTEGKNDFFGRFY
jgi:hypothetical protein